MNRGEEEKIIRQQMHEILDAVLDGNGFEKRLRETTGLKPTLFFRIAGHVGKANVDLHENGWESCGKSTSFQFSTINANNPDEIAQMKAAIKEAGEMEEGKAGVLEHEIRLLEKDLKERSEQLAKMYDELRGMKGETDYPQGEKWFEERGNNGEI